MPQPDLFQKVLTQNAALLGREFLVASSAAGAAYSNIQEAGVSRLPHQDRPEHHAAIAQLFELICLVDLR